MNMKKKVVPYLGSAAAAVSSLQMKKEKAEEGHQVEVLEPLLWMCPGRKGRSSVVRRRRPLQEED